MLIKRIKYFVTKTPLFIVRNFRCCQGSTLNSSFTYISNIINIREFIFIFKGGLPIVSGVFVINIDEICFPSILISGRFIKSNYPWCHLLSLDLELEDITNLTAII